MIHKKIKAVFFIIMLKPYSINISVNIDTQEQTNIHIHRDINTYTYKHAFTHIPIQTYIHRDTQCTYTCIHEYTGTKCTQIHTHREPIYTLGRSIFRNPPSREHASGNHHGLPLRLPSRQKSSMVDIATVAAPAKSMV